MRAWKLFEDDWSDEGAEEVEQLLPPLIDAGYVSTDDEAGTWAFTDAGVARAEFLEEQQATDS